MVRTGDEGNSNNNIWRNERLDNGMKNNETAGTDSLQTESFKYGSDKRGGGETEIFSKCGHEKCHLMEERDFLSIV